MSAGETREEVADVSSIVACKEVCPITGDDDTTENAFVSMQLNTAMEARVKTADFEINILIVENYETAVRFLKYLMDH